MKSSSEPKCLEWNLIETDSGPLNCLDESLEDLNSSPVFLSKTLPVCCWLEDCYLDSLDRQIPKNYEEKTKMLPPMKRLSELDSVKSSSLPATFIQRDPDCRRPAASSASTAYVTTGGLNGNYISSSDTGTLAAHTPEK